MATLITSHTAAPRNSNAKTQPIPWIVSSGAPWSTSEWVMLGRRKLANPT